MEHTDFLQNTCLHQAFCNGKDKMVLFTNFAYSQLCYLGFIYFQVLLKYFSLGETQKDFTKHPPSPVPPVSICVLQTEGGSRILPQMCQVSNVGHLDMLSDLRSVFSRRVQKFSRIVVVLFVSPSSPPLFK